MFNQQDTGPERNSKQELFLFHKVTGVSYKSLMQRLPHFRPGREKNMAHILSAFTPLTSLYLSNMRRAEGLTRYQALFHSSTSG